MTYSFFDFLGDISGYKPKYEKEYATRLACQEENELLEKVLAEERELTRQLKILVPMPEPPKIDYRVERDSAWMQQRIDGMELDIVRYPLDVIYALTNRRNFANIVIFDATDRMEYVKNFFDCDKFAMLFKVMVNLIFRLTQVVYILDYKSGHSYDLIVFPDSENMVLETQSDGMYLWTKRLVQFYSLKGAIAIG